MTRKLLASAQRKAFTLIELIAVVVVLGILAALAVPTFNAVKGSSAEQTIERSAQSVVNEAKALAAFDGEPISNTYIDAALNDYAGTKDTNPAGGSAATITLSRSGINATATIDASGAISVDSTTTTSNGGSGGGGGGAFTPTYSFDQATDYFGGSCNSTGVEFSGGPNSLKMWCASGALKTALGTLEAGDALRLTYADGVENFTIAEIIMGTSIQIVMTKTMRAEYGATFTKMEF